MKKQFYVVLLLCVVCFSGCALLQIPGQLIGHTFSLIGKALEVAGSMPKPPPGVFF